MIKMCNENPPFLDPLFLSIHFSNNFWFFEISQIGIIDFGKNITTNLQARRTTKK